MTFVWISLSVVTLAGSVIAAIKGMDAAGRYEGREMHLPSDQLRYEPSPTPSRSSFWPVIGYGLACAASFFAGSFSGVRLLLLFG
jgi:hypothetical protein